MALQGLVDWKGRPINQKRHGGVKATMFIYILIVMTNMGNIPTILNIVSFLHGTMHLGVADASTTATNFFGALCVFSFLGAFISDSYIKRFYTILIFAPVEILGYMLLSCQAHFPPLHPPPCDIMNHPDECTPATSRHLSLLKLGLYMIAVGEGALRVCAAALGGDQFDGDDPEELRGKISFFNWFTFCISLGGFVGLVFVVWVQNNEGWDLGFALAALMVLVGATVILGGLPFYRHQVPRGSPLTRILQVFVAAFRKRKLSLPEDSMGVHQVNEGMGKNVQLLNKTATFIFLDKAAVDTGDARRWSLCTVAQVEEAKIILRMVPVFLSSVLGYVPIPLLLTFTVQQGATMDTRLGATTVAPASLFIVPVVLQMLILVAYDRAAVPWLRRLTGYSGGVTHLQRVGVGFASNVVALAVAAAVEARRRSMASSSTMSVFWLAPQFFLLGVMDVTSFVGLLEFFSSEASAGMKSIGGAVFFCILGVASWLGSFLIQVVNRVTASRDGGGGHGWLDGANLNAGRLDLFYWLLALFGLVSFLVYLLCAWRYSYRHDPRVQSTMEDDKVSPASTKFVPV